MSDYTFDIPAFRVSYPAFANETTYPDDFLQSYWDIATCYISDTDFGYLHGDCRYSALTLMTAHLVQLSTYVAKQKLNTIVTSATIDKITVSLQPPPSTSEWAWWLNQTTYGIMLNALLQSNSIGGIYAGGSPQRSQFRGIGCGW